MIGSIINDTPRGKKSSIHHAMVNRENTSPIAALT
jgi:hypothetical protein